MTFIELYALTLRELRKLVRSPFLLFMTMVQPLLWLGLFGKAFNLNGLVQIPPDLLSQLPPALSSQIGKMFNEMFAQLFGGTTDYFSYLASGMLAVIILFTSMQSGMGIVWDRRFGFLDKLLAAPVSRASIVGAKVIYSVLRGLLQAILVFLIALALGLTLGPGTTLVTILAAFAALLLLNVSLSSIFAAIAIKVKSWETQMAVMNLLNLPLMFASNTLFPIERMPDWLQAAAKFNPLTYANDAMRQLFFRADSLDLQVLSQDFAILVSFAVVFTLVGFVVAVKGLKK